MKKIIIATKNIGKAAEFKSFFQRYQMTALSLPELEQQFPDVEETGSTFAENAALKSDTIAQLLQCPVIADDSGLIVDALNGEPGIFSARYAGENKDDQQNIDKLMNKLRNVPDAERIARFVCVLAVSAPNQETNFYTGYCEGKIARKQTGSNGFGYDSIFIPKGYTRTMAELNSEEKNRISHRSNAFVQLKNWLNWNLGGERDV